MRKIRNVMFVVLVVVAVFASSRGVLVLTADGNCNQSGPAWCTYVNQCVGTLHGWCDVEATQVCEWYCENYYVWHTEMLSIQCSGDPGQGPAECEAECDCKLPTR